MDTKSQTGQIGDELEQFAYVVSHDLQEQVRNISNFTGLLAKHQGPTADEDFKYYLSVVTESSAKLSGQLAALLIFSRIGRNHEITEVDCAALVQDVLKEREKVIQESHTLITVGELPVIRGNLKELRLVFENLIDNALKFRSRHYVPEIYIRCQNKSHLWEFFVSDNGIGIKEKDFRKIFRIFQKLHPVEEYPGDGTGLAFTKKAVEAHGGTIKVSTVPGYETVFCFTIAEQ